MISRRTALGLLGAVSLAVVAGCTAPAAAPAAPAANAPARGKPASDTLDVEGFAALVAQPGVVVLDVRTPAEYDEGHLADALLLDVNSPDFASKVSQLDKGKTYAVYCRSGNRSASALQVLKRNGITEAYHLGQGINAWKAAGKPVVR